MLVKSIALIALFLLTGCGKDVPSIIPPIPPTEPMSVAMERVRIWRPEAVEPPEYIYTIKVMPKNCEGAEGFILTTEMFPQEEIDLIENGWPESFPIKRNSEGHPCFQGWTDFWYSFPYTVYILEGYSPVHELYHVIAFFNWVGESCPDGVRKMYAWIDHPDSCNPLESY